MTLEEVINRLKDVIAREKKYCDTWKDSGDRGLCHHSKVYPLEEELRYLEELKDAAYEMFEDIGGEGEGGGGKGDDLPPSSTMTVVVESVEEANSHLTTAISTVDRLNLKVKPKLRHHLKHLQNELDLVISTMQTMRKEKEKEERAEKPKRRKIRRKRIKR